MSRTRIANSYTRKTRIQLWPLGAVGIDIIQIGFVTNNDRHSTRVQIFDLEWQCRERNYRNDVNIIFWIRTACPLNYAGKAVVVAHTQNTTVENHIGKSYGPTVSFWSRASQTLVQRYLQGDVSNTSNWELYTHCARCFWHTVLLHVVQTQINVQGLSCPFHRPRCEET